MPRFGSFVSALLLAAVLGACGQESAAQANHTGATPDTVAALPLKRGYYVASDTPCGQASNATTTLLRRNGLGGSRDFCEFRRIEKVAPNSYRVTQACGDLQDGGPPESIVATFTLSGETSFSSRTAEGWEHSARYCAQSSMPSPWRTNDISDVTG